MVFNVRPRGNINSVGPMKSVSDYEREEAEFLLRKAIQETELQAKQQKLANLPAETEMAKSKLALEKEALDIKRQQLAAGGGSGKLPAALQIANKMQQLKDVVEDPNASEEERERAGSLYNHIGQAAKTYGFGRGLTYDEQGITEIPNYGEAAGGIEADIQGAKERAKLEQEIALEPELRSQVVAAEKEAKGEISEEESKQSSRESISQMVSDMRGDFIELDAMGGIVNDDKSVVDNLLASSRASAPGQYIGKVSGTKEQTLRNQINAAKPKLLLAIMRAGGASARSLDSNTELKLWLSTSGDETRSVQSELMMLERLERMLGDSEAAEPTSSGTGGFKIIRRVR